MASLIYSAIASLDGYVADENDRFDWAEPDEEVHWFHQRAQPADRHLSARTPPVRGDGLLGRSAGPRRAAGLRAGVRANLARRRQDGLLRGRSRRRGRSRTRIEPDFDAGAVRNLEARAATDLAVGGSELAGQAIRAGLVDDFQLFVVPVLVGAGKKRCTCRSRGPRVGGRAPVSQRHRVPSLSLVCRLKGQQRDRATYECDREHRSDQRGENPHREVRWPSNHGRGVSAGSIRECQTRACPNGWDERRERVDELHRCGVRPAARARRPRATARRRSRPRPARSAASVAWARRSGCAAPAETTSR